MPCLSHKIRIYPNKHNQEIFNAYYDYQRSVWNRAIDERHKMYKIYKQLKDEGLLSQKELNKYHYPNRKNLRKNMKKYDWEYKFHNKIRDIQFQRLENAWKNFFNPNMPNHSMPKYKKKKDIQTIKKVGFLEVKVKNNKLILPNARNSKLKFTPIKMAEKIRFEGKIVDESILSNENGKWFISITIKSNDTINNKKKSKQRTAIDLNVKSFDYLVDDNFEKFQVLNNNLIKEYKKIKYYSKVVSKKRNKNPNYKTSIKYKQAITKLNNAYTKAKNIQEDNINKFISFLSLNFNEIIIEDLNVNSMKMNKSLCKSLHRAMFGKFKTKITNKTKQNGNNLIIANRFYPSTQRCSECGNIKTGEDKLGLSGDRFGNSHDKYVCYECGTIHNRDENAVMNLYYYPELISGI